jgi:hypothetical protein
MMAPGLAALDLLSLWFLMREPWLLASQRLRPTVHEQCFMR